MNKQNSFFNSFTQVALPVFTIGTQIAFALKVPQWGLIVNLIAQPFWFYSGWVAYKKAGQSGILITTIVVTVIIIFGIVNYWVKF